MDKVQKTPWWASIGFGRPEAPPDTDYADMGTAFGLDASLSPEAGYAPASEPSEATIPASEGACVKRR
jgi:hypothetical protein